MVTVEDLPDAAGSILGEDKAFLSLGSSREETHQSCETIYSQYAIGLGEKMTDFIH